MIRSIRVGIVVLSIMFIIGCSFITEDTINTSEMIDKYNTIVDMISSGEIAVESNGCVILPKGFKHLSDSGECFVVEFKGQTALYFYTCRGLLDESRGYVYITNKLSYSDYIDTNEYVANYDFSILKQLTDSLYLCTTG